MLSSICSCLGGGFLDSLSFFFLLLKSLFGGLEVDPSRFESDCASGAALESDRIICVRAIILAQIADAEGTVANDIVRKWILFQYFVVTRCRHVPDLVVELFVPDRSLSCFIFDGGLVNQSSVDTELHKWVHFAKGLGVASQICRTYFDVKKSNDIVAILP